MRAQGRLVAAGITSFFVVAGVATAPATADPADDRMARAEVVGVVERLADAPSGTDVAIRLPAGDRLPLTTAGSARPGDRVEVTVSVPTAVARAARAGAAVEGIEGTVQLGRDEVAVAATVPAASDSPLSEATQESVVTSGATAAVQTVKVLNRADAPATSTGSHEVVVALVVPRGLKAAPATAAQVTDQVAKASEFWNEQSRGAVTLQVGRISKPYASAFSCQDSPFQMWTEAARATGFTEAPNRHLVMVLPRAAENAGCSYGLASMGQTPSSGGIAYVADTAWPVLAHELGHNLGLAHAKSLECQDVTDVPLRRRPGSCGIEEYGDPFDVMAASASDSAGSLSTVQASRLGFVDQSSVVDVTSGTHRVVLNPVSSLRGVRAVRVRDPRSGATYFVEFRTRTGRDARLYEPMAAGVRVLREERATATNPWPSSVALDASPTGSGKDFSWSLAPAHTLTTWASGVTITVDEVARSSATVTVSAFSSGKPTPTAVPGKVSTSYQVTAAAPGRASLAVSTQGQVAWKASSAKSYDVVLRRVNGRTVGRTQTWYAKTVRTSARLSGIRGTTMQVRARGRGADGHAGAWSGWTTVVFR